MPSPTDGPGVVVDVEALRRAAELLRSSAPVLGEVTVTAGRAVADAAPAAGVPQPAAALGEFLRRWSECVVPVAERVDGYGVLLRATVEALVADDDSGAASFAAPPR